MLIILAVLAVALIWMTQIPGSVEITWFGYRFFMGIYVFLTLLLLLFLALHWALGLKQRWQLFKMKRRLKKKQTKEVMAQELLLEGMVAIAARDRESAQRCLTHLAKIQGDGPMTLVLAAQTALLSKDGPAIDANFQKMLEHPQTRFIGLRGMVSQHMQRGEYKAAQTLVRKVLEDVPSNTWALETAFDIAIKLDDWDGALHLLKLLKRHRVWSGEMVERRQALIFYKQAQQIGSVNQERAVSLLEKAHKLAPEGGIIAFTLARMLLEKGKTRQAMRTLEHTWRHFPHVALMTLYMSVEKDPLEGFKRAQHLYTLAPPSWLSRLSLAEKALSVQLWGVARPHLEVVLEEMPTQHACRLMAQLEDALGHTDAMRAWVKKSASAPADPKWVCQVCGYAPEHWDAVCSGCGSFDQLIWSKPVPREAARELHQHILPPGS